MSLAGKLDSVAAGPAADVKDVGLPLLAIRNRRAVDRLCATVRAGDAVNADVLAQTAVDQGIERRRVGRIDRPEGDVIMVSAPMFLMITRNCWVELESGGGGIAKTVRNFTREP